MRYPSHHNSPCARKPSVNRHCSVPFVCVRNYRINYKIADNLLSNGNVLLCYLHTYSISPLSWHTFSLSCFWPSLPNWTMPPMLLQWKIDVRVELSISLPIWRLGLNRIMTGFLSSHVPFTTVIS